ncbi:hypothetical protein GQ53DRAFT_113384 [Thozetella sp. PMI_491]|nr:hypothetical protein GQ53DRAFT_113384 [Thozetella sp. PMI_491]
MARPPNCLLLSLSLSLSRPLLFRARGVLALSGGPPFSSNTLPSHLDYTTCSDDYLLMVASAVEMELQPKMPNVAFLYGSQPV